MSIQMAGATAPTQAAVHLRPFLSAYAYDIACWVQSADELRWLAPSTVGPLTPEKICEWLKPNGLGFVAGTLDACPAAYGELNPMRRDPSHFWIGHVIVRPDCRGCGFGRQFVQALVDYAFESLSATKLSLVVFPDNDIAIECYRRAGFAVVGEESHRFAQGGLKHRLLRLETYRSN